MAYAWRAGGRFRSRTGHDAAVSSDRGAAFASEGRHCAWCGRRLPDPEQTTGGKIGRPRRYCAQPCRQRAYERRAAVQRGGLPEDAVVLSAAELADLQDRLFQLRCAAEDVMTAVDDGAGAAELRKLADELRNGARDLERLR
jgi:hypothetical protein